MEANEQLKLFHPLVWSNGLKCFMKSIRNGTKIKQTLKEEAIRWKRWLIRYDVLSSNLGRDRASQAREFSQKSQHFGTQVCLWWSLMIKDNCVFFFGGMEQVKRWSPVQMFWKIGPYHELNLKAGGSITIYNTQGLRNHAIFAFSCTVGEILMHAKIIGFKVTEILEFISQHFPHANG